MPRCKIDRLPLHTSAAAATTAFTAVDVPVDRFISNEPLSGQILSVLRSASDMVFFLKGPAEGGIAAPIGEGGFGKCYPGVHIKFDDKSSAKVCVKVVQHTRPVAAGPDEAREKTRNAYRIAQLVVPEHVRIFFEGDEQSFYVMALAAGTISHYSRFLAASDDRATYAATFVHAVGEDLAQLHAKRLAHHDVKHGNCFIEDGLPRLRDFDLVAPISIDAPYGGNEEYDAPERRLRDLHDIDKLWAVPEARQDSSKSDVYSLGVATAKILGFSLSQSDKYRSGDPTFILAREKLRGGADAAQVPEADDKMRQTWAGIHALGEPFADIISSTTALDTRQRPNVPQVLGYLQQYYTRENIIPFPPLDATFAGTAAYETLQRTQRLLLSLVEVVTSSAFLPWLTAPTSNESSNVGYFKQDIPVPVQPAAPPRAEPPQPSIDERIAKLRAAAARDSQEAQRAKQRADEAKLAPLMNQLQQKDAQIGRLRKQLDAAFKRERALRQRIRDLQAANPSQWSLPNILSLWSTGSARGFPVSQIRPMPTPVPTITPMPTPVPTRMPTSTATSTAISTAAPTQDPLSRSEAETILSDFERPWIE